MRAEYRIGGTLLACLVLVVMSNPSGAAVSQAIDALQLTIDPATGSAELDSLAAGTTVEVSAVVNQLSAPSLQSFQIGLEHDPSLIAVGVRTHPTQGVSFQPTLTDLYVGLTGPLLTTEGPHVLATWTFMRLPGYSATHPATIRIRTLENGEPSLYRSNAPPNHRAEFRMAEPVRIGAVGTGLWRFYSTSLDFVEGRSYSVEWASTGLSNLTLDSLPVADRGSVDYTVVSTTEHVLRFDGPNGAEVRKIVVDAIREPRIDLLAHTAPPDSTSNVHRINWVISGANNVRWGGGNDFVSGRGDRGVAASQPTAVTLRAENEWGLTSRTIGLNSTGAPMIGALWAEPSLIEVGERTRVAWSVVDASEVTVTPPGVAGDTDGHLVVQPESTTTYTLRASNADGDATRTLTIEVIPVQIDTFRVSASEVFPGDSVDIRWSVSHADSVWIEPGIGAVDPASGSIVAIPDSSIVNYTIHATRGSHEVTRSHAVKWKLPFAEFWFQDDTPRPMLTALAAVAGADSAVVNPGHIALNPPNGSTALELPGHEAQTFVLSSYNRAGVTHKSLRYTPYPPTLRTEYIPENDDSPFYLGMVHKMGLYTWYSTSFTLSSSHVIREPVVGTSISQSRPLRYTFWIDEPESLFFSARNLLFSVADTTIIGAGHRRAVQVTVDDPIIELGDSTTIHWDAIGNAGYFHDGRLEPLGLDVYRSGSMVIRPEVTTLYRVIQYLDGYPARYRGIALVEVMNGGTSLVADPMRPIRGSVFDLRVSIPEDAISANLYPGVGSIAPHSQVLQQLAGDRQQYYLEVDTPTGTRQATVVVEPEDAQPVPTAVTRQDFTVHSRGPSIVLAWNVESKPAATAFRIERSTDTTDPTTLTSPPRSSGEFIDNDVRPDTNYSYRLYFLVGNTMYATDAVTMRPGGVAQTRLLPNVPNPFNPTTKIRWALAEPGPGWIEIHDLRGHLIRSADLGSLPAGAGGWEWDGRDDQGRGVASGSYVVRFLSETRSLSQKIVLLK